MKLPDLNFVLRALSAVSIQTAQLLVELGYSLLPFAQLTCNKLNSHHNSQVSYTYASDDVTGQFKMQYINSQLGVDEFE